MATNAAGMQSDAGVHLCKRCWTGADLFNNRRRSCAGPPGKKAAKKPIRRLPVDKPQSEIRGVHNRLIETKPIFPILLASKWGSGFKVEFNFLNSLDILS
jgi:hypothetical protein